MIELHNGLVITDDEQTAYAEAARLSHLIGQMAAEGRDTTALKDMRLARVRQLVGAFPWIADELSDQMDSYEELATDPSAVVSGLTACITEDLEEVLSAG